MVDSGEGTEITSFADVGAFVWYLKMIPWTVENFSVAAHRPALERLHERIVCDGPLRVRLPAFWLKAIKAVAPPTVQRSGSRPNGVSRTRAPSAWTRPASVKRASVPEPTVLVGAVGKPEQVDLRVENIDGEAVRESTTVRVVRSATNSIVRGVCCENVWRRVR